MSAQKMKGTLLDPDSELEHTPPTQQIGFHKAPLSVFYIGSKYCVLAQNQLLCICWVYGMFSMCLAVLYLWIIWVHNGFVCVYFEFMLLSSTWWTQNGFKSAYRIYLWTQKKPEHMLAPICTPPPPPSPPPPPPYYGFNSLWPSGAM